MSSRPTSKQIRKGVRSSLPITSVPSFAAGLRRRGSSVTLFTQYENTPTFSSFMSSTDIPAVPEIPTHFQEQVSQASPEAARSTTPYLREHGNASRRHPASGRSSFYSRAMDYDPKTDVRGSERGSATIVRSIYGEPLYQMPVLYEGDESGKAHRAKIPRSIYGEPLCQTPVLNKDVVQKPVLYKENESGKVHGGVNRRSIYGAHLSPMPVNHEDNKSGRVHDHLALPELEASQVSLSYAEDGPKFMLNGSEVTDSTFQESEEDDFADDEDSIYSPEASGLVLPEEQPAHGKVTGYYYEEADTIPQYVELDAVDTAVYKAYKYDSFLTPGPLTSQDQLAYHTDGDYSFRPGSPPPRRVPDTDHEYLTREDIHQGCAVCAVAHAHGNDNYAVCDGHEPAHEGALFPPYDFNRVALEKLNGQGHVVAARPRLGKKAIFNRLRQSGKKAMMSAAKRCSAVLDLNLLGQHDKASRLIISAPVPGSFMHQDESGDWEDGLMELDQVSPLREYHDTHILRHESDWAIIQHEAAKSGQAASVTVTKKPLIVVGDARRTTTLGDFMRSVTSLVPSIDGVTVSDEVWDDESVVEDEKADKQTDDQADDYGTIRASMLAERPRAPSPDSALRKRTNYAPATEFDYTASVLNLNKTLPPTDKPSMTFPEDLTSASRLRLMPSPLNSHPVSSSNPPASTNQTKDFLDPGMFDMDAITEENKFRASKAAHIATQHVDNNDSFDEDVHHHGHEKSVHFHDYDDDDDPVDVDNEDRFFYNDDDAAAGADDGVDHPDTQYTRRITDPALRSEIGRLYAKLRQPRLDDEGEVEQEPTIDVRVHASHTSFLMTERVDEDTISSYWYRQPNDARVHFPKKECSVSVQDRTQHESEV